MNCPKLEGILTGSNFNKPSSSRREDLFGLLKIWKQSMSVMLVGIMLLFAGCTTQPLPGAIDSNSYFAQGVEARIRGNNGIPLQLAWHWLEEAPRLQIFPSVFFRD